MSSKGWNSAFRPTLGGEMYFTLFFFSKASSTNLFSNFIHKIFEEIDVMGTINILILIINLYYLVSKNRDCNKASRAQIT